MPLVLPNAPRSPDFSSTFDTTVPSGTEPSGRHIADGEGSVLAGVDELASVHAFICDEGLGVQLEAVRVAEDDLGEWCSTARVVYDVLHNTTDISMALCVVVGAELGWCFIESGVSCED